MKKLHSLALKWSGMLAALALLIATSTSGATCFFTAYQPEVPEQLRRPG